MSVFSFKLMSLGLKFRHLVKPRKNVLKDAGIKPGSHVLDFGCGPGGYILPLAKIIGKSGQIYALDISPHSIESVKALVARKGLTNVETIISGGATGLPDSSLDVVLLYDILHDLSNPPEILAELHRVLKPGGILSISDHHLKDDDITSRVIEPGLFRLSSREEKVYNFSKVT